MNVIQKFGKMGTNKRFVLVAQSCLNLRDPVDCSTPGSCPPSSPGLCSNPCPLSQWCHPTISSFVAAFSCFQSFPASGSFPKSQLFASGGQSIEASASASVLPMHTQSWFPLGLTGLISLQSKGFSEVFSNITVQKHQFFGVQPSVWSDSHIHTRKPIVLTRWTFGGKVTSLLFNMLSRLVIAFLPRSKRLLISWLQSSSAVILEPKKIKAVTVPMVSPSIWHEVMGPDAMILVFWMLSYKPTFSLFLPLSSRGSLVFHFLP